MTKAGAITLTGRYYRVYPRRKSLGCTEEQLSLGLDDTAFLLIDVYGLGFDPDHNPGNAPEFYKCDVAKHREIVVDHIKPAKDAAKLIGLPVVYVTNHLAASTNENTEWRNMSIRTCGVDVLEAFREPNDILAFSKVIAPKEGDYLIKKQMYSGFFETHLDSLLRSLGIRNLVTVGFDTRVCLGMTVTEAMYRNYRVIVLRDCCGASEYPETKKEAWVNRLAIRFIESSVGYTATSKDFIRACHEVAS